MNRIKMAGLATVGALGLSVTGFVGGGVAHADLASDLQTVLDNAPTALDGLIDDLQATIDTYTTTNSIDQTAFTLIQGLGNLGGALGNGTEQFGALGLGLLLGAAGVYSILQPFVVAFDADPASVLQQLNPNDIPTILGNLPAALEAATPEVIDLAIDLLKGDLIKGADLFSATGQPGVLGDAVAALGAIITTLVEGTSLEATVPLGVGIPLLVVGAVVAGYVQQAEDGLAPVFAALAPLTAPVIEALEGVELPDLG